MSSRPLYFTLYRTLQNPEGGKGDKKSRWSWKSFFLHFFRKRTFFKLLSYYVQMAQMKKETIQDAQIDVIPQINACLSVFKTLLAAVQLFETQNPDVFPFLAFPCKTQ